MDFCVVSYGNYNTYLLKLNNLKYIELLILNNGKYYVHILDAYLVKHLQIYKSIENVYHEFMKKIARNKFIYDSRITYLDKIFKNDILNYDALIFDSLDLNIFNLV